MDPVNTRDAHVDTFEEWPRSTPGRTVVAGLGCGALGGAVVGALSLLGEEGFPLASALFHGGVFGCLVGVVVGGLTGAVAGALAAPLTRTRPRAARAALVLTCGALIGWAGWFTWPPQAWASRAAMTIGVGATAAAVAWVVGPWCLAPRTRPGASSTR